MVGRIILISPRMIFRMQAQPLVGLCAEVKTDHRAVLQDGYESGFSAAIGITRAPEPYLRR